MFKEVRKREYPLRFQRSVAVLWMKFSTLKFNGLLNRFFPNIISANWIIGLSEKLMSFKMLKGKARFNIKYRNSVGLFRVIFAITEL